MTADEWLAMLERRAPGLRAAGVTSFKLDGAEVHLAPLYVQAEAPESVKQPADDLDLTNPLDDPMTFGGKMPGYRIPTTQPAESDEESA